MLVWEQGVGADGVPRWILRIAKGRTAMVYEQEYNGKICYGYCAVVNGNSVLPKELPLTNSVEDARMAARSLALS